MLFEVKDHFRSLWSFILKHAARIKAELNRTLSSNHTRHGSQKPPYFRVVKILPMQNAVIAAAFDEIADYMEVAGENPFKTRAYRKAAEAVASYTLPIEDAAEEDTLRSIDGLGEATAAKVKEFLATGQMRFLERLREEYPASLLDLIRVPGLGPKKVSQLYKDCGIASVEALKVAIETGALAGVKGFGASTLTNVQRGIERLAQMNKRLPIGDALPLAQSFIETLSPSAERMEIAGSLRRGCDTVGDINLVASTETPAALLDTFTSLPQALSITEHTENCASIHVRPGIEIRLRTYAPQHVGGGLLSATGSKDFLEEARQMAAARGLDWGEILPYSEEAEVFAALGAQFVEPELREKLQAWQAAADGKLPRLVTEKDIRGDLHSHSTWSDGSATIRQMAQACRERGYAYFAVTDHSKALAMANGLNAQRLREQAKEIAEVQEDFPDLKILRGIECDIMRDGSMDLDDDILHELDIVVASVHSAFNLDEAEMTERVIRAVTHPAVDILAHPTGRVLGVRPPYDLNMAAVIEAARESGTALEINASERLDLKDEHAYAAREAGIPLSIDSDAHSPRMLPNVKYGVITARRAWCEAKDVLNAWSLEELLAWLHRPQSR